MLRATEEVLVLTVLPPASWTVTTGWAANAMPLVEPEGLVVKASWEAAHTMMVTLVLEALVSPLAVAVSV
jgi:hypothetical protein